MSQELPSKALIVDKDEQFLNVVVNQFKTKGINCIVAKDWNSALYQFNHNRIDFAIVNLELDELPGTALIQKWRQHETVSKRNAAFFLSTGLKKTTAEDIALIEEIEGVTIINKPFNFSLFMHNLTAAMQKASTRAQYNEVMHRVIEPLLRLGKYDKVADYATSKLEPLGEDGCFRSVQLHVQINAKDLAIEKMERLLASHPKKLKYINELAKMHLQNANFDAARKYFEIADNAAPSNLERITEMINLYCKTREGGKCAEKMQELVAVNPEKPELKLQMIDRLLDEGFEDEAKDFSSRNTSPATLIKHFNNKGVMLSKDAKYLEAIEEYEKALKLLPGNEDNYRILFNLAISNINLKTRAGMKRAQGLLEDCLALKPDFTKAQEKLSFLEKFLDWKS